MRRTWKHSIALAVFAALVGSDAGTSDSARVVVTTLAGTLDAVQTVAVVHMGVGCAAASRAWTSRIGRQST